MTQIDYATLSPFQVHEQKQYVSVLDHSTYNLQLFTDQTDISDSPVNIIKDANIPMASYIMLDDKVTFMQQSEKDFIPLIIAT